MTGNVGEAAAVLDRFGVEARTDRRKFRTSDRGIGVKAVRTAALDDTELRHRGNRLVVPLAVRNIGKFVVGGQISVADVRFEQAEEDRCCFRAADIALRVHLSVRIANDVGEMVVAVELVRHTGSLPACVDRLVAVHRHACDLLRQRLVRIPAGKGITLAGRGLIECHLRAGRIALILVSCAAVRLIVQRIAGRMMGGGAVLCPLCGINGIVRYRCGYGRLPAGEGIAAAGRCTGKSRCCIADVQISGRLIGKGSAIHAVLVGYGISRAVLPLGINRNIAGHIGRSGKGIACTVCLSIPAHEYVAAAGRFSRRQFKVIYNTDNLILHHDTMVGLGIAAVLIEDDTDTVGHLPHIVIVRTVGVGHTLEEQRICQSIGIPQYKHILRGRIGVFLGKNVVVTKCRLFQSLPISGVHRVDRGGAGGKALDFQRDISSCIIRHDCR